MNATLLKGVLALVPASILFLSSVVLFFRRKKVCCLLRLLGAGCLMIVVFAHICEAVGLFPWTHWGGKDSAGHYLDLWSATLGLVLFPLGYLFHALKMRVDAKTEERV